MDINLKNKIERFLNSLKIENLEILDYVCIENVDSEYAYESIYDQLWDSGAFDIEIKDYVSAMGYLLEHDASLMDSLILASALGHDLQHLNSKDLASMLASKNAKDDLYHAKYEINNFFINL